MATLTGLRETLICTVAMAAVSTAADAFWAAALPEHRAVYGIVHGGIVLAALGAVLAWGGGAKQRLLPAAGGLLIGVVAAALFYVLFGVLGTGAMFLVWTGMWLAFAFLLRAVAPGPETTARVVVRALLAAVLSGLAFWSISGIWLGPHDPGPLYVRNLVSWCIAFAPGFGALLLGRPRAGGSGGGQRHARRLGALGLTAALGSALAGAALAGAPAGAQQVDPEARLAELGIELYAPPPPVANYVRAVRAGDLVFLAGHGPTLPDGSGYFTGQVGSERTVEEGYEAARLAAIALLSSLKAEIGDLGKVRRIVRVFGMVNAVAGFTQQPEVINGASDLLVEVFGDRGKHARAAVGMASLPRNISVEIEMVVEVERE